MMKPSQQGNTLPTLPRTPRGFTLVELLFALVVLVLIMGVLMLATYSSVQAYTYAKTQTELHRQAAYLMERMARNIRRAESIDKPSATNPIQEQFDGIIDGSTVKYQLLGNFILREKIGASGWISITANAAQFTVERLTTPSNAVFLKITLTLQGGLGNVITLETQIFPRNLALRMGTFLL